MNRPYNIGTIELMPYPEHGEFVIVGVFAVDAERRGLSWKLLESNRVKRLTQFFPELDRRLFTKVLRDLRGDWEKLAQMVNQGERTEALNLQGSNGRQLFERLIRPREGMVRQVAKATVLTADIDLWLDDAFARMVHRVDMDVIFPEEQKLTDEVQQLLTQWKVRKSWKRRTVGNEDYHATFPFTYKPVEAGRVVKAIKPLYLAQASATKIIEHGDLWLQKVRRLRQFNLSPETIIFPVERPNQDSAERADRAELIIHDLQKAGVVIFEKENFEALEQVAKTSSVADTQLFDKRAWRRIEPNKTCN